VVLEVVETAVEEETVERELELQVAVAPRRELSDERCSRLAARDFGH